MHIKDIMEKIIKFIGDRPVFGVLFGAGGVLFIGFIIKEVFNN